MTTKTTNVRKSGGQSGSKLSLTWDDLSTRERIVLTALVDFTRVAGFATLSDLASMVLRHTGTDSTSTVRNQLRRLARAGYFVRVAPGAYEATVKAIAIVKAHSKVVA